MKRWPTLVMTLAGLSAWVGCTAEPRHTGPAALEEALSGAHPGGREGASGIPLAEAKPHRQRVTLSFTLRGEERENDQKLVIRRTIDRGPEGAWRFLDERSWSDPELAPKGYDDRREVIYDGEGLAIRRAWGPWMDRETMDAHAERLLTAAYDAAPAVLAGLDPYLQIQEDEVAEKNQGVALGLDPTPAGQAVRWVRLSLSPEPRLAVATPEELRRKRDTQGSWHQWWAATHRPSEVRGHLARTSGGDVVVGEIHAEGSAGVEGRKRPFLMHLLVTTESLPAAVTFQLPEERLPATRARPWKQIREVMGDDLAEIYRRRAQ